MDSRVAKSSSDGQRVPIGILGIGVFLPQTVRENSWWSDDVVARWRVRAEATPPIDTTQLTDDERRVVAAMERLRTDPFQGTRRRHVITASASALEIEIQAAREAIRDANVKVADIDLLLTHSGVPDYLGTNTSCSVHARLGLRSECFSLQVEASSNSFLMQAAIAEQAIRSGAARYALLVQSCTYSQILPRDAENSPWMGDAATAVVIGHVADEHGFMSWEHRTDGTLENTFVAGIPGKHWFDDGRVIGYPANPPAARRMFLSLVTFAREVCTGALSRANVAPGDVAFYASHQGTSWFREVTQSALGLANARYVDTFADTASVYSSNIPLCLHRARAEGRLSLGDLVLMFSGGGGTTYTCGIMKWSA